MRETRFDLATLLLLSAALPIWIFLIFAVSSSPNMGPLRFIGAPVVLCGITVAIQRLLVGRRNSWSIAAFAAGVIVLTSISVAQLLS
jgi:hypothetical protein